MALPGVTMNTGWETHQIYKVGGKMFAIGGGTGGVSLKASEVGFVALTESGLAIPAPYMARMKWVFFEDLAALGDEDVKGWLEVAYREIAGKLPKKTQKALGLI
jgi:predicted DNA-binding protein (MmcQ/YjbR family)